MIAISPDNQREQLISGLGDQTGVRTLASAAVYPSVSESDAQTDAAATFPRPLFPFSGLCCPVRNADFPLMLKHPVFLCLVRMLALASSFSTL